MENGKRIGWLRWSLSPKLFKLWMNENWEVLEKCKKSLCKNAKDWIELQLWAPAFLGHISFQDKVHNWAIAQLSHNDKKNWVISGNGLFFTFIQYLYKGRTLLTTLRCQDNSKWVLEPTPPTQKKSQPKTWNKTMYLSYQSKHPKMSTNGSISQL